jgi:hypothetical protein
LYINTNQIKTFQNSKNILISNNILNEEKIENLLNDEILFCRILIDNNKISYTIDEIIKRVSIEDLEIYCENFYNDMEYYQNTEVFKIVKDLNNENKDSLFNLSNLDFIQISRSQIFYDFLKEFIYYNNNKENQPIFEIDSNDVILKNYPIFPFLIDFIIKKNKKYIENDDKNYNNNNNNSSRLNIYKNFEFYTFSNEKIMSGKNDYFFNYLKSISRNQNLDMEIFELKI